MIVQYTDKVLNRAAIESSLKHDEEIVCENATVIADKNGNITGWINNDIPLCIFTKEE
jgi:hypothetical protein